MTESTAPDHADKHARQRPLDLIALGECLVEFSRRNDGSYRTSYAGDAFNTLFYASRLGLKTGFISALGDDLFTPMILDGITRERIDTSRLMHIEGRRNGLYFIELDQHAEYTFHFWRAGSAATQTLLRHDITDLAEYCADAPLLLLTGVGLAVLQGRERLLELLQQVHGRTRVVFDTNYRSRLWDSPIQFQERMEEILPYISIALPTLSDLAAAYPGSSIEEIYGRFADKGIETIVIKMGAEGCALGRKGGALQRYPSPVLSQIVDTTGAGDAFNAGFLAGVLREMPHGDCCALGHRLAARALSVQGALDHSFGSGDARADWLPGETASDTPYPV